MEPYWGDANGHAPHSVKYENDAAVSSFPYCTESSLNFSTNATGYSEDDAEYATGRRNKTSRQDPLSHRIIEKRRRDRMNSCLADLSRLIPPQYQRKGRGRIEKTEIIEMAIRHLKHLQSECMQKENEYRMGYTDCMKEAAKFLYDSQMQEFCYRLLARLQEHCEEVVKNDCFRSRSCHATADNISASSGSPHQTFHAVPPLCQLRDMLSTTSDIEHSNDHNDVKDLSFRNQLTHLQRNHVTANQMDSNTNEAHHNGGGNNGSTNASASTTTATGAATSGGGSSSSSGVANNSSNTNVISNSAASSSGSVITSNNATSSTGPAGKNAGSSGAAISSSAQQPHQAPVITSTAPASLHHHTDSSNHDFDSSREPILHTDTSNMHSPPPRDTLLGHGHHLHHHHHHHHHPAHMAAHLHHHHQSDDLLQGRLRNFSESSHDIEHNNNYKYKNHIKERFNHELHDEETSSEHCPAPPLLQSENLHAHSDHSKDGTEPEIAPIMAKKRKMAAEAANTHCENTVDDADLRIPASTTQRAISSAAGALLPSSIREDKPFTPFSEIKTEVSATGSTIKSNVSAPTSTTAPLPTRSFAVPIFALHSHGTYYVPLNVDYNILIPFLNGIDLLEKNFTNMPVVHPININVNFMPSSSSASLLAAAAAAVVASKQQQQQQHPPVLNGTSVSAAMTKAKLEAITNAANGW
ncbi:transcription factor cwo isoform X1 [Stomoxys calcitrans]|uniref:transcription factor cwo isoform X1 n=2 Tax=Stomoxys calcitrans TaxID=35570 RepID=UPI0027E281F1|nr:transcription factor cwo isoform X1 [Stomoxys calcitrans]XP_013116202.2 transcription factor cwo isoform X1 [Stomoxys calcitrans]XP_059218879.1 transcription factor cwo isoform X1 [Stomoxys calcitrans]XP_059218880.1 transcription factor cwo isoform X1 [Stomoxys calcitrans]XP_059218881.1 transcription factor cwo isoform X1 [Stomoxys calcitrans]XP_059218882.1 transcription factor cwo isoform X1 [Stomoxys calcitrans]XP_059218883.1 transcription factor cwo isoform X1 [Stomoxys calcitrans]XP_0